MPTDSLTWDQLRRVPAQSLAKNDRFLEPVGGYFAVPGDGYVTGMKPPQGETYTVCGVGSRGLTARRESDGELFGSEINDQTLVLKILA